MIWGMITKSNFQNLVSQNKAVIFLVVFVTLSTIYFVRENTIARQEIKNLRNKVQEVESRANENLEVIQYFYAEYEESGETVVTNLIDALDTIEYNAEIANSNMDIIEDRLAELEDMQENIVEYLR